MHDLQISQQSKVGRVGSARYLVLTIEDVSNFQHDVTVAPVRTQPGRFAISTDQVSSMEALAVRVDGALDAK